MLVQLHHNSPMHNHCTPHRVGAVGAPVHDTNCATASPALLLVLPLRLAMPLMAVMALAAVLVLRANGGVAAVSAPAAPCVAPML